MKTNCLVLALGSLTLVLLFSVGCNWSQLLAFRAQMRAFNEFTAWEEGADAMFVFKQPLLTLRDLNEMGIYPELLEGHQAVLRYQRRGAPPKMPTGYEFRFQFFEGKLAGVVFPAPLREGLGQDNIRGLFALMGGARVPGAGMRPLPKSRLVAAGLFPGTPGALGREAVIDLQPLDQRNRPIYIKMTEAGPVDHYDEFLISFKRRP